MKHEVSALSDQRNAAGAGIVWRYTTADARTNLRRLYPAFEVKD